MAPPLTAPRAQKMHLASHLLLLLAGLLVPSHGHLLPEPSSQGHPDHQEAPSTGEGSPSLKIAPGNTAFALRFYHLMASQSPGSNIFFSPLSISSSYAMLSLGARSHSQTQILEGLGFNLTEVSESDIHQGFQHLWHTLHLPGAGLEMHGGSALFLSRELPILPGFLNDSVAFYESKSFLVDFHDSAGTTRLINDHVQEETQGKIVDLVSDLSTDIAMVLVNYIYFKALWEKPFALSLTTPQDFYVDENTVVKVPMMQDTEDHWYLHDRYLPCSVLRMDYKGNAMAFFILPNRGKMKQVEEVLTPEMLTRWNSLLRKRYFYRKLELHFPKFSISGSYKLDQILPKLGFVDVFSPQADLSGITEERKLQVSKSFHKAILEVDEAGTQAAAATGSFTTFLSYRQHSRSVLRFNRPFLVVIFSTDTQSILFLGKVVNPTKP